MQSQSLSVFVLISRVLIKLRHQPALRRNFAIWDWNTIIAIQLLPLFEADPPAWEAVTSLNQGSHGTNDIWIQRGRWSGAAGRAHRSRLDGCDGRALGAPRPAR